jgi:hypothetical protein
LDDADEHASISATPRADEIPAQGQLGGQPDESFPVSGGPPIPRRGRRFRTKTRRANRRLFGSCAISTPPASIPRPNSRRRRPSSAPEAIAPPASVDACFEQAGCRQVVMDRRSTVPLIDCWTLRN